MVSQVQISSILMHMHVHTHACICTHKNTCKLLIDAEEECDTQFPLDVASLEQLICGQHIVGALNGIGKPECKLMYDQYIIVHSYKETQHSS